ncbi:hypothetical protein H4582DRAFT_1948731 [Lactarius indigo]|nr:hypothetical protein H4582DRAFT_1948731 [Lactarius indigo]
MSLFPSNLFVLGLSLKVSTLRFVSSPGFPIHRRLLWVSGKRKETPLHRWPPKRSRNEGRVRTRQPWRMPSFLCAAAHLFEYVSL